MVAEDGRGWMVSAWRVAMDDSPRSYQLSLEKNPTEMTGFNCTKSGHTHQIGAFLSQRPEPNMSTDNLIELARQADAIFGAQDDGIDGFETQMRRVVTHGHRVGSDAIEVVVADIEAAMFVCGFELIRSRDDAGYLYFRLGLVDVPGTQSVRRSFSATLG